MKFFFCLLAAALGPASAAAQTGRLDLARLRVGGLAFHTSKSVVARHLGPPLRVVQPHYECGAYSSSEQGQPFYQLRYPHVWFIGNAQAGYDLDFVYFAAGGPALTYGRWTLDHRTTVPDLQRIFGPTIRPEVLKTKERPRGQQAVSVPTQYDDSVIFWFSGGRLTKLEHWTPC